MNTGKLSAIPWKISAGFGGYRQYTPATATLRSGRGQLGGRWQPVVRACLLRQPYASNVSIDARNPRRFQENLPFLIKKLSFDFLGKEVSNASAAENPRAGLAGVHLRSSGNL